MQTPLGLQLTNAAAAVCRVFGLNAQRVSTGYGTAFAVREGNYVITANHVVEENDICMVGGSGPPAWHCSATVVSRSKEHDVAVVRLDTPAPSWLRLAPRTPLAESEPLICWEDSAQDGGPAIEPGTFKLSELAVIPLGTLVVKSLGGRMRLALSGRFRQGMSGGPVFAPMSDEVVGIVCAMPQYDPFEVVAAWTDQGDFGAVLRRSGSDVESFLLAQLKAGVGIAVPASDVLNLLNAIP